MDALVVSADPKELVRLAEAYVTAGGQITEGVTQPADKLLNIQL